MYQLEYPWLLALLPLPLLVWWLVPAYREETRVRSAAVLRRGRARPPACRRRRARSCRATNWVQKAACAALLGCSIVLALARPQFVEPPIEKTEPQRDLMLALDLSQSMDTRDFRDPAGQQRGPRRRRAHRWSRFRQARGTGDRIGLIAFGDAPYPLVPFTLDHLTVQTMIADALARHGGTAHRAGRRHRPRHQDVRRQQGAGKGAGRADRRQRHGEQDAAGQGRRHRQARTASSSIRSASAIPMPRARTSSTSASLQKIASATGGRYFFGQDQSQLAEIYATLDSITPANQKTLSWRPRIELFHYPAGRGAAVADRLSPAAHVAVGPCGARRPGIAAGRGHDRAISTSCAHGGFWPCLAAVALVLLVSRQTDVRARWRGIIAPAPARPSAHRAAKQRAAAAGPPTSPF